MPDFNTKSYDVVALGNAIVDILGTCDDTFIEECGMTKGVMQLLFSEDEASALYQKMPASQETSGGSAANTIAVISSLGGKTGFMGKVSDDQLGHIFAHDIKASGTDFTTPVYQGDISTARCMILVTPDAERTMNTYLGSSVEFNPEDIDSDMISKSRILYLEGYLYDKPKAKQAFDKAAKVAQEAGCEVALTLSDPFCVDRHRDDFVKIITERVDILFANEDEVKALYPEMTLEDALAELSKTVEIVAMTVGAKGSLILNDGKRYEVPAVSTKVVDTTGAGDSYAGGFLYGYTQNKDLSVCGAYGSACAGAVISTIGARYSGDLNDVVSTSVAKEQKSA